ncbi:MAG: FHA domain-containing protein [Anaerolineaceae bacterium]|nr:FHA domain-containing protein [Anaerolineaceae bacterium]
MNIELHVTIMSGVLDGQHFSFSRGNEDGETVGPQWRISVGRSDDRDIYLQDDLFLSRQHAYIIYENDAWWLEDCSSRNGSFLENGLREKRFQGKIPIKPGQLFKLGRTWMRIDES